MTVTTPTPSTVPATSTEPTTAIRHRIGVEAPPAAVHAALATIDGLASWWTNDTTGDAGVGGRLSFRFGGPDRAIEFDVLDVAPDRVEWLGVEGGPPEWVDTHVVFELSEDDGETFVLFTHSGWREPVPFQAHCSTKWASYLLSMKALLEDGEGRPFPGDLHISRWD